MRKLALLALILHSVPSSGIAAGRTDISRQYCLPDVLDLKLLFPPEEGELRPGTRQINVAFTWTGLKKLHQTADFPDPGEVRQCSTGINRCLLKHTSRKTEFTVTLSDEQWLRAQSALCRLKRRFDGCKPATLAEMLSVLGHRLESRFSPEARDEKVSEVPCASVSVVREEKSRTIRKCLDQNSLSAECQQLLTPMPLGRPVLEQGIWKLTIGSADHTLESEPLEPVAYPARFGFQHLRLTDPDEADDDGSSFYIDDQGALITSDLPLAFRSPQEKFAIEATYDVQPDGLSRYSRFKALIPTTWTCIRLRNIPRGPRRDILDFTLDKDSLLEVEPLVIDSPMEEAPLFKRVCDRLLSQGNELGKVEKFFCVDHYRDLEATVSRRARVRFQFLDQDGTGRYVVWDLRALAERCRASDGNISCDKEPLELHGAALDDLLKKISDPRVRQIRIKGDGGALPRIRGPLPDLHDFNDRVGSVRPLP